MPPLARDQATSLLSDVNSPGADCVCQVKCVLVGDGAVGKTSLVVSYTTNGYPTEYVPTAFDNYSVVVTVDDQPVRLQLCDTAGQDDFDTLRPLCYPHTDVFLVCFSVVCPTSFSNVSEKWLPEIKKHCPRAPFIIVGTQCDLRSDVKVLIELAHYREQPVSETTARQLAQRLGAVSYIECSALTQKNLKEVFDTALVSGLQVQKPDLVSWGRKRGRTFLGRSSPSKGTSAATSAVKAVLTSHSNSNDGTGRGGYYPGDDHDGSKKRGWKKFCCFS